MAFLDAFQSFSLSLIHVIWLLLFVVVVWPFPYHTHLWHTTTHIVDPSIFNFRVPFYFLSFYKIQFWYLCTSLVLCDDRLAHWPNKQNDYKYRLSHKHISLNNIHKCDICDPVFISFNTNSIKSSRKEKVIITKTRPCDLSCTCFS